MNLGCVRQFQQRLPTGVHPLQFRILDATMAGRIDVALAEVTLSGQTSKGMPIHADASRLRGQPSSCRRNSRRAIWRR